MNHEDKKTFAAPLLVLNSFDQGDVNTTSARDVWSIGEIEDIGK